MHTLSLITLTAAFATPMALSTTAPPTTALPSPCCITMQDDDVQEMASGTVTKIDAANKTFNLNTGREGAKDVMVAWNDATVFMLEGQVVKWDELVKENAKLTVTHKKGLASKVEGSKK